jgi:DNA-directed RNA polymerase sigma subunit (sigma70/sigma32)
MVYQWTASDARMLLNKFSNSLPMFRIEQVTGRQTSRSLANVPGPNRDETEQNLFTSTSFEGLQNEQAEFLVLQFLASSPSLETLEIAACHARLQQGISVERAAAQQQLRIHLLPLALGISRKYPPLTESLPHAIEAIDVAIEKWEPSRGFSLGTYASWFIRQAITRDREP